MKTEDKQQNKHTLVYAIISAFSVFIIFSASTAQTSAWTGTLPQSNPTDPTSWLGRWDWPLSFSQGKRWALVDTDKMPNHTDPVYAGSGFDPASSSYLIGSTEGATGQRIFYSPGKTLTIKTINGENTLTVLETGSHVIYACYINDKPFQIYGSPSGVAFVAQTCLNFYSPTALTGLSSITAAVNVTYDASYQGYYYPATAEYTANAGIEKCDALDFGCWLAKGFKNIGDGLKDIVQASFKVFTNLFIPDSTAIKSQFDDTNATLIEKLGFLSYPFVFLSDIVSAFTTNTLWCTDGNCRINTGNVFGSSYVIDIMALKTLNPDLYNVSVIIIRASLILLTLSAVYHAYMRVIRA